MTSSMLAGERKWASSRRGGMTVLGKVAVPKPINLPSQKLENHGLDPNVEIVPKGSLSWGSRPSSSSSNPWGSSAASTNADGTTVSPHDPSCRPTSGSGLSRPSTAGSDRHESSATTWGPNSRPTSASGVLTSNQSSLTSSRPLSAETRPGSSHLSRFAEPVYDKSVAWGSNGTSDKMSVPSKVNDFSLSSGDFPTLGSEKDNTPNSSEPHDHGSHVRPGSGSGRHAPVKDRNEMAQADHNSGTVDRWTRDASPHFDDGFHHNADKWQGDSHQYVNPNVPPQHYDAWPGPPMNAPPGVWYRGPPPAGPPYSHVPHGGFPMEPFPYYHPQIPPPLASSQAGPPPGPGPRGHHPRNGEFYRPQMPDAFIRPGMPVRPGFYPGSVPYDGYYGPPMGYNPNDRERSLMGMPPGPPVYNMCPPQNPSEHNDPHFRGGVRGPVGNRLVSEQLDPLPPEESHGPYKVLKKHENERNADMDDNSWDQNIEKTDHPRPSFHKNEWEANTRRNDDMPIRRNTLPNQGYPSDPVHIAQGSHNSKASNESWGNKAPLLEDPKNPTLIKKIEDLNAKVRGSDIRRDADQTNKMLINPKGNSTITFGSISTTGDPAHPYDKSSQAPHGVRADHGNRADHHSKGRLSNQENHISHETNDTSESTIQTVDPADGQAQRARLREMAKQRAIELQKEEEERIKEQKAKANAKLEELNRRTLAAVDGTVQIAEKNCSSVAEQQDVDVSQKPIEKAIDTKAEVVTQISENSQQDPVDQSMLSKQSDIESRATRGNNGGVLNRQNRPSHRQKQSVQGAESSVDKSTVSEISGEVVKNSGINVTSSDKSTVSETNREVVKNLGINVTLSGDAIEIQEPTLPNSSNILSESNQHKKRNNKSSKNRHKLDDPSASREADHVKPESPQFDLNPTTVLVTGSKDAKQSSTNQTSKPQHSRRMPRNSHPNRHHVVEAAVWAPVRPQNKEETIQDDVTLPEKIINSGQNNLKSKRAEMERYVPKPVAKELAQQGSIIQSAAPSSPKKTTLENMADLRTIPASSNVGPSLESKSGDNKQVKKTHGTGRQRDQGFQQDSKKVFHKSTSQHEEPMSVPTETRDGTGRQRDQRFQQDSKKVFHKSTSQHEEPMSVPTETRDGTGRQRDQRFQQDSKKVFHKSTSQHEEPMSVPTETLDGTGRQRDQGFQQDSKKVFHKSTSQHEEPISVSTETRAVHEWDPSDGWFMPDEIPPTVITPVVKDEGKGKKPANKGQRSTVKNHMESRVEVEVDQNERPASSKENRSSHWQPKPQAYKGGWSGGGQNANLEAKRESRNYSSHIQHDEAAHDGRQEVRRERKPTTFRGRTYSPNQNQGRDNMEDEPHAQAQFEQQQHVSSGFRKYGGQNNRPSGQDDQRKNNYQHNANINREKQRPNLHYQYQPVGSNNNNSNRSSQLDAPSDTAPRYRERSSGQSRRGGGNFNGRQ